MSTSTPSTFEETIRDAGEGWLIDSSAPPEAAMIQIQQTLAAVHQEAQRRLGDNAPNISEAMLLNEYPRNPQRVKAFLQSLRGTRSPDMLLMVWRILEGMSVKSIQMNYRQKQTFELEVVLSSPGGEGDESYTTTNIRDFALLRHVGILEFDGKPIFDGFYLFRFRASP